MKTFLHKLVALLIISFSIIYNAECAENEGRAKDKNKKMAIISSLFLLHDHKGDDVASSR